MRSLYTPYAITVSDFASGPPSSPSSGDIWIGANVDGNGTRWQFQYNAGSASAYKWEFVGGGIMLFPTNDPNVLLNALTSTGSTQGLGWTIFYHSSSTLTLARAGVYAVSGSYNLLTSGAASITLGPSWTSDITGNHWVSDSVSASSWTGVDFADTLISVSANDTVCLGLASSAPGNVAVRWNAGGITPIRIA